MSPTDSANDGQETKGQQSEPVDRICFAIMPFGGWFDRYYEEVFSPAIIEAGLLPRRADDLYRPGTIVNDIWTITREAAIVLADLTGKNPNVLYELGLAHAIAKPVIILAESINDIPFDLRALRILEYDKNAPAWGELIKSKITQSIKEVLASPLKSVLPAFLDVDEARPQKISRHEKEILEIRQELEGLRVEVKANRGNWPSFEDESIPTKAKIMDMLKQGSPPREISARLGVSPSYVYYIRRWLKD